MILNCNGEDIAETVKDREVRRSIWLTINTSLGATALLSLIAIPFAYVLARRDFPGKRLVMGLIDLPVVIPHSAAGIALLAVLNRDSPMGRLAEYLNISFIGSPLGIAVAMAYVSLPFLINTAREGFAAVPQRYENAALTLGASPLRVFLTIALPLAGRSVLTGFILMFSRGLSEFGAVVIIAYHPMITPVLIYQRFNDFGLKYARGVAVVFIGICLAVFMCLRILSGESRHAAD
jgi:molybdate/tungstate transport system permease protein